MSTTGTQLRSIRKELDLDYPDLAAILHFLGGRPPARSTFSRAEKSKLPPPDLVAVLRLLLLSRVPISLSSTPEAVPDFARYLDYRLGPRMARTKTALDVARRDYWAMVINYVRQGTPVTLKIGREPEEGYDQDGLERLVQYSPKTAAYVLRSIGFGLVSENNPRQQQ